MMYNGYDLFVNIHVLTYMYTYIYMYMCVCIYGYLEPNSLSEASLALSMRSGLAFIQASLAWSFSLRA